MHEQNPYLSGLYAPQLDEQCYSDLEVTEGSIPTDINGLFCRNGPNPKYAPLGRYHWFDGDGMLHALHIAHGKAHYRNRWVQTSGLMHEQKANRSLWRGLIEPDFKHPISPLKDTSNTDIISFGDTLISSWYQSGGAYQINPLTLETQGIAPFQRTLKQPLSAHAKVDPTTGELLFFSHGLQPPHMYYGVARKDHSIAHWVPIELPGPRFPHDIAITKQYTLLFDFPVLFDQAALSQNRMKMIFDRSLPSRYGILPRYGDNRSIRWFEGRPGYVYHTINAWEEAHKIIMLGCFVADPVPERLGSESSMERLFKNLQLDARYYYWEFDLQKDTMIEKALDDRNSEFPTMNLAYLGSSSRYSWHMDIEAQATLRFQGIYQYDLKGEQQSHWRYPDNMSCSEAPFIPRQTTDPAANEDDGYLITYVAIEGETYSEAHLFLAHDIGHGPIAKIKIPHRIPLGFHACWHPLANG